MAAVGHSMALLLFDNVETQRAALFYSNLTSFVLDYVVRQKLGGINLTYGYFKQLPINPPNDYSTILLNRIVKYVQELVFTAYDMSPFGLDLGYGGPPFMWDDERCFVMRCELDALYFHLYGIARDDVDYIMDTFPIVRRKDEAAYGEYRTKRTILEMYDAIAALGVHENPDAIAQ